MSIGFQLALGLGFLAIGYAMSRWASRYDVKSWLTDFFWRFLFRQGWRDAATNIKEVRLGDEELRKQVSERIGDVKADAARLGQARAVAKHGALFAIAYAVNFLAGFVMLAGLLILAHAGYRWLA